MIIELIIVIAFVLVCAGDCYSTAKMMRHNHKMITDRNYKRRVNRRIAKTLRKDETNAEMSKFGKRLMQKYGADRTMLYIGVFGYGPLAVALLYFLLTEGLTTLIYAVGFICFMFGILYRQIWSALTLKKRFGVNVWED